MRKDLPMILIVVFVSLILILSLVFGVANLTTGTLPTNVPITDLATNTTFPTSTQDVCTPGNISAQVDRLHAITREFDDTFGLAQSLNLNSVVPLVQDMQRIKRNAEDLVVPVCLNKLKEYQLLYMNSGIEVFTAVLSITSSNPNLDQNTLNQITVPLLENVLGAAKLYLDEQAKLMGWTPVPIPTLEGSVTVTPTP
jgi:hypothetical protein